MCKYQSLLYEGIINSFINISKAYIYMSAVKSEKTGKNGEKASRKTGKKHA